MSFFNEGGMTAPEVEQDPVSGNEVPPGSLPEEVRDDVDADLSGGEYVVPADVLRYYGMKFFEDLRKQAKTDLAKMDSEGRIGGEPSMEAEGELSPEEMAMLQEVMSQSDPSFNSGGMVLRNPEFYGTSGYNEGGVVDEGKFRNPPAFNTKDWETVGSFSGNTSGSEGISVGSYYKTYIGPNGETQLILFVNGKPTTPIPEGFVERDELTDKKKEQQAQEELKSFKIEDSASEERAKEQQAETQSWAERNYDAIAEDPIAFGLEQLKGEGGLFNLAAKALGGGAIGGAVGAAMELNDIAAAKAAQKYAEAKGIDTTPLDEAIQAAEDGLGIIPRTLSETGLVASGDNFVKGLYDVEAARGGKTQTEAVFKSEPSGGSDSTSSTGTSTQTRQDDNTDGDTSNNAGARGVGSETSGTSSSRAKAQTAARNAGVSAKTAAGLSGEQSTNPGGFDEEEGNWGSGPMNKGGLVKRRKKKTKK